MVASVPADIKAEINLSFAISDRIDFLMQERGLSKIHPVIEIFDTDGKSIKSVRQGLCKYLNFTDNQPPTKQFCEWLAVR